MADAYLSRTPSSTGDRRTFTMSVWVKKFGDNQQELMGAGGSGDQNHIQFEDNRFQIRHYASSNDIIVNTAALFRDKSAWYHVVCAVNTSQSTASDRVKLYVNGELQSLNETTYPSQNYDWDYNVSGTAMYIGRRGHSEAYFWNGCMAHYHWIDGTQYAASDFGETDSTTGIWKPILTPSVNYGTNGFFLKFDNTSNFGEDSSGNNNDWTMTNTITQTLDTPSNNFSTLNPLVSITDAPTFSNGNNTIVISNAGKFGSQSTLGMSSGKYYAEFKMTASSDNDMAVGVNSDGDAPRNDEGVGFGSNSTGYRETGTLAVNGTDDISYGNSYTVNDIIGVAIDLDNNYLYFSKNGTWQNSGDPTSGSSGTGGLTLTAASSTDSGFYFFNPSCHSGTQGGTWQCNFGNGYFGTTAVSSAGTNAGVGTFEYDVPSGYKALCTKNINAEEYS